MDTGGNENEKKMPNLFAGNIWQISQKTNIVIKEKDDNVETTTSESDDGEDEDDEESIANDDDEVDKREWRFDFGSLFTNTCVMMNLVLTACVVVKLYT